MAENRKLLTLQSDSFVKKAMAGPGRLLLNPAPPVVLLRAI